MHSTILIHSIKILIIKIVLHLNRKIRLQRENFEYKLARTAKSLEDYLRYITFERTLLTFIEERRKNRRIFDKKGSIDHKIITKILALYNQVTRRYPENVECWDNYVKFCKITKNITKTSSIWDDCLKFHANKPEIWLKAGLWEWKENKNLPRAISLISRGIQRHPECVELYSMYIKVEISSANDLDDVLKHNNEKDSDQVSK